MTLEKKYERVVELIKEWQNLNLATRTDIIDIQTRYDVKAKNWIVEVLGGEETGETLEKALDKQIKALETDDGYLESLEREREVEVI